MKPEWDRNTILEVEGFGLRLTVFPWALWTLWFPPDKLGDKE